MSSSDPIKASIRQFVSSNFLMGAENFKDDDSFLEKSIIDSTGVLELVAFVEETYHFKVQDEELLPDNLDSVTKLAVFIGEKHKV